MKVDSRLGKQKREIQTALDALEKLCQNRSEADLRSLRSIHLHPTTDIWPPPFQSMYVPGTKGWRIKCMVVGDTLIWYDIKNHDRAYKASQTDVLTEATHLIASQPSKDFPFGGQDWIIDNLKTAQTRLVDMLQRIYESDMVAEHDDGRFWRGEIKALLGKKAK